MTRGTCGIRLHACSLLYFRWNPAHLVSSASMKEYNRLLPLAEKSKATVFNERTQSNEEIDHLDPLEFLQRDLADPTTSKYMKATYENPTVKSEIVHGEIFLQHPIFRKEVVEHQDQDGLLILRVGDCVEVVTEDFDQPQIVRIHCFYTKDQNWFFSGHWFWRADPYTESTLHVQLHEQEVVEDLFLPVDISLDCVVRKVFVTYGRESESENADQFFCHRKSKHKVYTRC